MDLIPPLLSLCVMVTCLIGAARCSNPDKINCCPEIAPFPLTEPPPDNDCYEIEGQFRYTCIDGYVRKAGTSNQITCKQDNSGLFWTKPSLQCIHKRNCCPEIAPFPLTVPPRDNGCYEIHVKVRYTCIDGYVRKAGTSNQITCKQDNSGLFWTKPSLQCTPDPNITRTPKTKTTESPTDIPTTTATATSTSLQMTQSVNTSASVTTETQHSTEPTSSGLQDTSNHSLVSETRTTATEWTTSASNTANPSDNGTQETVSAELPSTTTVGITCASLVVVSALIGFIFFLCYKRRSKHKVPPPTPEEQVPMNEVQPAL